MSSNKKNQKLTLQQEEKTSSPASLPVFFRDPRPLESTRHAKASVKVCDFAFAEQTNSVPIVLEEFFDVARHYPIVFTLGDTPSPLAILGLEKTNYFVTPEHAWEPDHYIPAYARQYPFIFHEQQELLSLAIDEGSPHYSDVPRSDATNLFTGDGTPTPVTENALKFCSAIYAQHKASRELGQWLKANDLLVPSQSEANLASGKLLKLEGFQVINEKAVSQLPDNRLLELRDKGWVGPLYFALASRTNWQRLLGRAESANKTAA